MPTRKISVTEDAYRALLAMRRPGESLSDVIRRLTRRGSLTDLCGILRPEAAEAIADAVEGGRVQRIARRRNEMGHRHDRADPDAL